MIFLVVTHYRENEMEKIKRFLCIFSGQFNLIELEGEKYTDSPAPTYGFSI